MIFNDAVLAALFMFELHVHWGMWVNGHKIFWKYYRGIHQSGCHSGNISVYKNHHLRFLWGTVNSNTT
jgi:hypothetical protein